MTTPVSNGANALKLDHEVNEKSTSANTSLDEIYDLNKEYNEELLSAQGSSIESIIENNQASDYEQSFSEEVINEIETKEQNISNGLENFGVEEETAPDLFSSDSESVEPEELLSTETTEDISEADDLEIPAFLRRQKN